MLKFFRRPISAAAMSFRAPVFEMIEQRRLYSGTVHAASSMMVDVPGGEYPIGTILPSAALRTAELIAQRSIVGQQRASASQTPTTTGNRPAEIASQADLLGGGMEEHLVGGDPAILPESTPSSATIIRTVSTARVSADLTFATSEPTSQLGGAFAGDMDAISSDNVVKSGWLEADAEVGFGPDMVFSYISLLSPGSGWSSSAAGVSKGIPEGGELNATDAASVGIGLPLSNDWANESVDHLEFHMEVDDADPTDDQIPVNPTSDMFVTFVYYNKVSVPGPGDVNGDGVVDETDVTLLNRAQSTDAWGDVNGDSLTNGDDKTYMFSDVLNTVPGDFDLDGKVDFNDYLILQANFGKHGTYGKGDANGDLTVNFNDYLIMQSNFGYGT